MVSGGTLEACLRNQNGGPSHPTRSARTEAGMDGVSSSKARMESATPSNFDEVATREYVGGVGEVNALATVTRNRDKRPKMALCDKPSPILRRRISAQSFIVIVHPICRGWSTFQRAFLVQFSATVDKQHWEFRARQGGLDRRLRGFFVRIWWLPKLRRKGIGPDGIPLLYEFPSCELRQTANLMAGCVVSWKSSPEPPSCNGTSERAL